MPNQLQKAYITRLKLFSNYPQSSDRFLVSTYEIDEVANYVDELIVFNGYTANPMTRAKVVSALLNKFRQLGVLFESL